MVDLRGADGEGTEAERSAVAQGSYVEGVGDVVDLSCHLGRGDTETLRGAGRTVDGYPTGGGVRRVAAPHEEAGNVEAVVGVEMRQEHGHLAGIGVALQAPSTPGPKSMTRGGVSGAVSRYPDAGESGPATLPEHPRTVMRIKVMLPCRRVLMKSTPVFVVDSQLQQCCDARIRTPSGRDAGR